MKSWMTAPPSLIRRNLQFKFASDLLARAIQFGFIVVAARRLGIDSFGVYSYAVAVGFVLAQVCDLGLQIFVTREIARDPREAGRVLGTTLIVKIILFVITSLALLAYVFVQSDQANAEVILVLALATMLSSFVEFFNYAFRGYQRLEFEAGLNLAQRLFGPAVALVALWLGASLRLVAWNLLLSNLLVISLGYYWLRKYFARLDLHFTRVWLWYLVREIAPLGLAIVFSGIYVRADVLMLQSLQSGAVVGVFNAAQRLTEPLQILPAIGLAAIFPAFASERNEVLRRALGWRTLLTLLAMGCALALVGWFGAETIVAAVYGSAYAPSAAALRWLALALVPMYLNYALTHFLIALGRQWLNALFTFTILLGNVGLNFWLIPLFGASGAALALVLSELVLFIFCSAALLRSMSGRDTALVRSITPPIQVSDGTLT